MESAAPERIEEAVRAALGAGRPRLAGRLVGLLPAGWVEQDPDLERAQKAAKLMLLNPEAQADQFMEELQVLFEIRRKKRMRRLKERSRKRESKPTPRDRRRKR